MVTFFKPQVSCRLSTSLCSLPLHNTQKTQFSKWQAIAAYKILGKMQQKHKSTQSNLDVGNNLGWAWEVVFQVWKSQQEKHFTTTLILTCDRNLQGSPLSDHILPPSKTSDVSRSHTTLHPSIPPPYTSAGPTTVNILSQRFKSWPISSGYLEC